MPNVTLNDDWRFLSPSVHVNVRTRLLIMWRLLKSGRRPRYCLTPTRALPRRLQVQRHPYILHGQGTLSGQPSPRVSSDKILRSSPAFCSCTPRPDRMCHIEAALLNSSFTPGSVCSMSPTLPPVLQTDCRLAVYVTSTCPYVGKRTRIS